jgi:hypothetical protein
LRGITRYLWLPAISLTVSAILSHWIPELLYMGLAAGFIFIISRRYWKETSPKARMISSGISMVVAGVFLGIMIDQLLSGPGIAALIYLPLIIILVRTDIRMWCRFLKRQGGLPS